MEKLRVFLADARPVARHGLASAIGDLEDMEVVGEASAAREALEAVARLRPNIVVMDIDPPDLFGIKAVSEVMEACPGVPLLVFTNLDAEGAVRQALEAGARGYVLKTAELGDVLEGIRRVCSGDVFIAPVMAARLAHHSLRRRAHGQAPHQRPSERELEVLRLLAQGYTNREIAEALHISEHTARTYRQRLMSKLGLHSRRELVRYALERDILRIGP